MSSLKLKLREGLVESLDLLGVNAVYRQINSHKILLLNYHGICDDDFDGGNYSQRHMRKGVFRRHVAYLREKGFHFASLLEICNTLRDPSRRPQKMVTLTFDDGFRNVVRNAYPIMQEFGAKGCIYVISDLAGTRRVIWPIWLEMHTLANPEPYFELQIEDRTIQLDLSSPALRARAVAVVNGAMARLSGELQREYVMKLTSATISPLPDEFAKADWAELRSMDPAIMEIGSHTRTHANLAAFKTEQALDDEVGESRRIIEQKIERPVLHFCYPWGRYNDRVVAKVRQHGYMSATTTNYGPNVQGADLMLLKRIGTDGDFTKFKAQLSGAFGLYVSLRDIVKGDPIEMIRRQSY